MTHNPGSISAPAAVGGYRQYVEVSAAGRLLFVSGQIGQTAQGDIPTSGYEQCRLAWLNVLRQLESAGYTADQLIKATVFVTSAELIGPHQQARNDVLGAQQPALTVLVVSHLADARWSVEVEVVAAQCQTGFHAPLKPV